MPAGSQNDNAGGSRATPSRTVIGAEGSAQRPPRHVVGIGASAGGLDALEKLFAALPVDTGAAYVVVQHLSPDHKSMMASLLARHTSMPVVMVEDDMPAQADRVYLIPPGSIMHLDGAYLRLTPKSRGSFSLPIDIFFRSLAEHFHEACVGVVLSGTGSDGTRGAGAINEAGGLLIAQDPQEARFDGMPRSVIATGLVDAVLPVEAIAQRLVAHLRGRTLVPGAGGEGATAGADGGTSVARPTEDFAASDPQRAMRAILHLLLQSSGIDFGDYKPGTVSRRIERRVAVRRVGSLDAYLTLLSEDRDELQTLRREMLIPVSSFFRDTEAFDALRRKVVEPLVQREGAGAALRVWCAGVSTGEEAYSLAMLFLEAFEEHKRWPALKIFATDVEQAHIDAGAAGVYPESIAAEVSARQLERFFVRRGEHFAVKPELRQCIVFARHNLLVDPPFTRMDLVVCRNTLIYFRPHAQERILRRLQYALSPGGHLFLGSSESLGALEPDYATASARHKIWRLVRAAVSPLDLAAGRGGGRLSAQPGRPADAVRRPDPGRSAVDLGYRSLLQAYAPPPAILVHAGREVVHCYGEVHRYLKLREGQASLEVGRILSEPLVPVAAALLFKVEREKRSASSEVLLLPPAAGDEAAPTRRNLRLSAWPVGEHDEQRLALLVFEELQIPPRQDAPVTIDLPSETSERIEVLEQELAATRESLQSTIEDLEASNEELQSTNEELMASNEELQSSNEELQSVNEELNSLNSEYQEKIDILHRMNADLENLSKVVSSGTVFVDQDFRLTRFSPEASLIFHLRDSDIGRPLSDLNHVLEYPELISDLRATLSSGEARSKSVRGPGGRFYLVKMLPYRIPSSASMGVVATFIDTTSIHDANRLQNILDALAEHVAVVDEHGRIALVNRAWRDFATDNGDPELRTCGPGTDYLEVCRNAGDGPDAACAQRARDGVRAVLESRLSSFSMEYPCNSPSEERWFVMHVRPLPGELRGAVISHVNITEWVRGGGAEALPLMVQGRDDG